MSKIKYYSVDIRFMYYYIHLTTVFSRTTWVSRHQKAKPSGFCWSKRWWVAVASAGPCANHLHLAPDKDASTSPLVFLQAGFM